MSEALFPAGWHYELIEPGRDVPADESSIELRANQQDAVLLLRPVAPVHAGTIDEVRSEEGATADEADERDLSDMPEPMLPLGIAPLEPQELPPPGDNWVEPLPPPSETGELSSLFDRLAGDADLYTPLTDADEEFRGGAAPDPASTEPVAELAAEAQPAEPAPVAEAEPVSAGEPDLIAAVIEYADDPETEIPAPAEPETREAGEPKTQWLITGRGFARSSRSSRRPNRQSPPHRRPKSPPRRPSSNSSPSIRRRTRKPPSACRATISRSWAAS